MTEERPATPYAILGEEGIRALVDRFYDRMSERPDAARIRALHAADLEPMRDRLTTFFVSWMGGPSRYSERFGPVNVPSAHAPFDIAAEDRDAWLACFRDALEGAALSDEMRAKVFELTARMAEMCRTVDADGTVRETFRGLRAT